jgi:P-type conjugative transfer protein TrbL
LFNLPVSLVSLVAIIVILYCFGRIAVELLLVQIGSRIILAGGIFLLAFIGLQWTRDYAERYIHTFFHVGIKMLFMYVLTGIGTGYTKTWVQTLEHILPSAMLQYSFAVVMATFVFYMLCLKLPEQAAVYFTGRMPMTFEPVPALPAMVKGAYSGYKNVKEYGTQKMLQAQGMAKATDTAFAVAQANLQAQGKTPTSQEIQTEAIRTLGEAKRTEHEKKVDETPGGKLAKDMLDTLPKPKKSRKTTAKKDAGEDFTI